MPSEETTLLLKAQATSQMKPIQQCATSPPTVLQEKKGTRGEKYISYNRKLIFSITNSKMGWAYLENWIILQRNASL